MAKVELDSIEGRIEWMSRPIFITLLTKPQISIHDKWEWHLNSGGKVDEACCMVTDFWFSIYPKFKDKCGRFLVRLATDHNKEHNQRPVENRAQTSQFFQ
jgi:hypothetical protein